jgi:hypothetical protein
MSFGRLRPLQSSILKILAPLSPTWTLTGGAALAAFHLKQRETQDLDLFWRQLSELGNLPREVRARLTQHGLTVSEVQSGLSFHRLKVTDGKESCIVDLVAEPSAPLEPPQSLELGGVLIQVDTPHEILVNKLAALLSRSELRDLIDVKALLESGGSLERALTEAPRKDAGFSALTLAWVLHGFPLQTVARSLGLSESESSELSKFQTWLIDRLVASHP